jgi:putative transposase
LKENLYLEDLIKTLPVDKRHEETLWLSEVDASALQQSIRDLFVAYKNFFEGRGRFPKFHRKGKKDSFRVVTGINVDVVTSTIKAGKCGWIKAKGNFEQYQGESIQSITVRRESDGNWYCSVLIKRDGTGLIPDHSFKFSSCGIDVGVVKPLTVYVSDNDTHKVLGKETQRNLERLEKRRKRYQRAYARKEKGSNNQHKARTKVGKAYFKERCVRKDWQEKDSTRLAKTFALISIEKLKVKNMTKSSKGTREKPGKNVKAKSGLNRELLRLGFSYFMTRLEQKCVKYGSQLLRVNPAYTSLDCSCCGHRSRGKESRKSQSRYVCVSCGYADNADVNAAKNILQRALA